MNIGILLLSSPESEDGFTVCMLAEAFLQQGDAVDIFMADDGIYNVVSGVARSVPFAGLLASGASISICAQTASERQINRDQFIAGVNCSSLYSLAQIVGNADRFLSFSR